MESAEDMLRELATSTASGELVAAAGDVEVHVYFHEGRVAWATTSEEPQAFLRHFVEAHGADRDGLRDVIEECRRSRKRFGQTVVEWGLATPDQVRDSLRYQITGALGTLRRLGRQQALFLPKKLSYTDDYAFDLDEVLPHGGPAPASDSRRDGDHDLLAAYLEACPDVAWAALVPPGAVEGQGAHDANAVAGLLSRLVDVADDANSITLRALQGAVTGRRAGRSRWLFAGIPGGIGLGLPTAVMAHVIGSHVGDERRSAATPAPSGVGSSAFANGSPGPRERACLDSLAAALEATDELMGAVVITPEGSAGVLRPSVDDRAITERARRLSAALHLDPTACLPSSESVVSSLRYERLALHVRDERFDVFGVALDDDINLSFWIALDGHNTAGIGWALLAALARQVEQSQVSP